MKKIMILGAGYTQIPLLQAAKRLNCQTVVASIPGDYPCFSLADECAYVDISDPEAVVQAAGQSGIQAIATCGLDLGMRAIGAVSETLGIPGPSRLSAELAGNKYNMKCALKKAGVQTADFHKISTVEELEAAMSLMSFPVMIKAVDLMGSRGIFRCDTPEEARLHFRESLNASRLDYCLIEEFLDGTLFGAEAMIQNGRILFILPDNTETVMTTTLSPVGHSIPLEHLESLQTQVYEQAETSIRALGLDNCPINCDLMLVGDKVYVIELTGRSGATGLSEMTGAYFGVNYYEMIVKLALGEDLSDVFCNGSGACLTHTMMSDQTGTLLRIEGAPAAGGDILECSFNVKPGDPVQIYTNGRDRIGQLILRGDSLLDCRKRLREILSQIHLVVE